MEQIERNTYLLDDLQLKVKQLKANGKKIVFTNGCFDLVHLGHLQLLWQARELGDFLIIGLNSDESVARLKGPKRPIKDQKNRSALLASLAMIDAVILFDQDTPLELIQTLLPDVLCKGGDWQVEQIVGSAEVLANGGSVKSLPFLPNHSTTALANKIKADQS